MSTYLSLSYANGCRGAFTKLGLRRLPEMGYGEENMLQDADMPESIRQTELDSYLQRALTTPLSSEQEFMESGRDSGTLGGGLLGGSIGAATGYGLGKLRGKAGLGAAIGGLGLGTAGALLGRPLGAESGRREHGEQSKMQEEMGDIYTDPYKMQRELQKHLLNGRRKHERESREHEQNVAERGRTQINMSQNNSRGHGYPDYY
jgi:hypothetical protein